MIPRRLGPPSRTWRINVSSSGNSSGSNSSRRASARKTSLFERHWPRGRDRRRVIHHVEMAVRAVNVDVLELRRRRQDDIGVIDRVGREQLVNHHEQVFAAQSVQDLGLVGGDGGRVAVIDIKCAHRRARQLARQCFAELVHVHGARARRREVGTRQLVHGEVVGPARR